MSQYQVNQRPRGLLFSLSQMIFVDFRLGIKCCSCKFTKCCYLVTQISKRGLVFSLSQKKNIVLDLHHIFSTNLLLYSLAGLRGRGVPGMRASFSVQCFSIACSFGGKQPKQQVSAPTFGVWKILDPLPVLSQINLNLPKLDLMFIQSVLRGSGISLWSMLITYKLSDPPSNNVARLKMVQNYFMDRTQETTDLPTVS